MLAKCARLPVPIAIERRVLSLERSSRQRFVVRRFE
jgi:hypothetical protein